MSLRVTAYVMQRGTGARAEPVRESRHIAVDAESYEDAQREVLAELPEGWIVASWRVERDTANS